jgi:hypothetical protein
MVFEYNWPLVVMFGVGGLIAYIIVEILERLHEKGVIEVEVEVDKELLENKWFMAFYKAMTTKSRIWYIPVAIALILGIPTIIIGGMPRQVCCCSCDPSNLTVCQADLSGGTTQYILRPIIWPKKCAELCGDIMMNLTGTLSYEEWKDNYLDINYTEGFHDGPFP